MREVLSDLLKWWEAGETVGVGTVVATFRSAPRRRARRIMGRSSAASDKGKLMSNLRKSTHQADAAREECTCEQRCGRSECEHDGTWHTHADDPCAVHPERLTP